MVCKKCGSYMLEDSLFCTNCGERVINVGTMPNNGMRNTNPQVNYPTPNNQMMNEARMNSFNNVPPVYPNNNYYPKQPVKKEKGMDVTFIIIILVELVIIVCLTILLLQK